MARLKTNLRVTALLRLAQASGAFAVVLRRGDPDAGALWVIVRKGVELFRYMEAMGMSGRREWYQDGPFDEAELQLKTNKAVDRDPDLWIIEIEDSEGRAFLDGELPKAQQETDAEVAAKALFRGR